MFNMKALFIRALLALSLIGAAPAVLAGPTYQVSINAASLPQARYLDLQFLAPGGAAPATAFLSNLSGDLGLLQLDNATGDLASGFSIGNDEGFNGILFELLSTGSIRFDLRFSTDSAGDGTTFSAALLDEMYANLGGDFPLIEIALMPGLADEVRVTAGVAELNAVPEPSDWLLVATGLFLLGATRRFQARR